MTATLTTSKGTFLFVGVPFKITIAYKGEEESEDELYIHGDKDQMEKHIVDPLSEIVAQLSALTEGQAREVVDPFIVNYRLIGFNDYVTPTRYTNTAIDSLHSLMQAERLYTSNIYTQPDADSSKEHTDAYNEMQSRTFPDWLIIKVK